MGFLLWEIRVCFTRGKPAATESRHPTYGTCHNPPSSDVDYGIFNVRTDVNACDCTRGCTDTVRLRESALKVDSGRKIPCRTGESNLRLRRAGPMPYPTELHPHPTKCRKMGLHWQYYWADNGRGKVGGRGRVLSRESTILIRWPSFYNGDIDPSKSGGGCVCEEAWKDPQSIRVLM